jgi:hypothetical protein
MHPGDMWAVVVYDGADRGVRRLPYLSYAQHEKGRPFLIPPAPTGAGPITVCPADLVAGVMNLEAARVGASTLFVFDAIAYDLRL